jgi:hypothetical protein
MVALVLTHRQLRLAAHVTRRASFWCRTWLGTNRTVWSTRAVLILGLLTARACTQSLTAIESNNANAAGSTGSPGCINMGCNFTNLSSPQCCDGARCNALGICVAVDAGSSYANGDAGFIGPGQACTGDSGCFYGFRCQAIGNYKVCVSSETQTLAPDGHVCQLSSDCSSLYCDSSFHCAAGAPCGTRGDSCFADKDCCSNRCVGSKCASADCSVYGDSCDRNEDCCTQPPGMTSCVWLGTGNGSRCLASTCRHQGDACTSYNQCCRGQCNSNRCQTGTAPCSTFGQNCSGVDECCSTLCNRGTNYQWQCGRLDGCQPEGESCSDDNVCCSKKCTDAHCASGAESCLNEGELCVGQCCNMSCSNDWYFVSRCSTVVQSNNCRSTGESCAFGAQCCNGARCEPDSTDAFKCGEQKYY